MASTLGWAVEPLLFIVSYVNTLSVAEKLSHDKLFINRD